MSYATTVIENQHKLYSLGEQEGYRKIMQSINDGKVISNYDLITSTTNNPIPQEFSASYVYYKDFQSSTMESSDVTVEFTVSGMVAGRTAIVIGSGNAVVDSYEEDNGVISDYNYINNGDEEFNEENCNYGQISTNKAIQLNGVDTGFVCKPFKGSDDKYITGSIVRNDIKPVGGRNEWNEVPAELEGKEYIVFQGSNYTSAASTIKFEALAKEFNNGWGFVRVYMFCISPLTFDTEWTQVENMVTKTRYQNYMDNLNVSYLVANNYIAESDIAITDGTKYRIRRWDALYKLFEDCGNKRGFGINPNRLAKTGFTETIADFDYTDYLAAWIPYPCDATYIVEKLQTNV